MTRSLHLGLAACLLLIVSVASAEDRFFDSAGVKIHYVVQGQGTPVVLIHGFTSNIQSQWTGILEPLSTQFQVIAIDNRGHGGSDKPHDPKQYGTVMADDVLRLMDHLKIQKADLVGYSMGGFITGYLVANHPERVISAALGGAGWRQPNDPRLDNMTALAQSLEAGKGIGPLIEMLTPAGQPKPSAEQVQLINQMILLSNDTKALAACVRGLDYVTVTEAQLKANKVPILALIGAEDPLKIGVDEMAQITPNLQVEVLPGADHMTAFAQPRFLAALTAFLASHQSANVPVGAR